MYMPYLNRFYKLDLRQRNIYIDLLVSFMLGVTSIYLHSG